ncbi:MAG: hypothetical protein RLP14_02555 [Owenweeksia sp.]
MINLLITVFISIFGCSQNYQDVDDLKTIFIENKELFNTSVEEIISNKKMLDNYFEHRLTDRSFIISEKVLKQEFIDKEDTFYCLLKLMDNINGLEVRVKYTSYISYRVNIVDNSTKWITKSIVYSFNDENVNKMDIVNDYSSIELSQKLDKHWTALIVQTGLD